MDVEIDRNGVVFHIDRHRVGFHVIRSSYNYLNVFILDSREGYIHAEDCPHLMRHILNNGLDEDLERCIKIIMEFRTYRAQLNWFSKLCASLPDVSRVRGKLEKVYERSRKIRKKLDLYCSLVREFSREGYCVLENGVLLAKCGGYDCWTNSYYYWSTRAVLMTLNCNGEVEFYKLNAEKPDLILGRILYNRKVSKKDFKQFFVKMEEVDAEDLVKRTKLYDKIHLLPKRLVNALPQEIKVELITIRPLKPFLEA